MLPGNIITSIKESDKIIIMPHLNVDGDGYGSSLALGMILNKMGKHVKVLLEEAAPEVYTFLPGSELVDIYKVQNSFYDLAIALDTGDMGRLGQRADIFSSSKKTINIDHHNTNTEFAFYNYVDSKASAVGEIVYQLIKELGENLDRDISTCLYVAIATDTGGFRYSNTTAVTHQIAGELLNSGVDVADISQKLFDSTTLQKVKLSSLASDSLELLEKGKISIMVLTDEMMAKAGAKEEDCDGIVNIGRSIRGVEVSILLRQRKNGEIKGNLRSNTNVDVSAIAGMFGGGGHKKAAGFTAAGKLEDIKKQLIDDIKEEIKRIK